jgi:predicted Zn-dependent protease
MTQPQAALEKALAAVKSAEASHTQPSLRLLSATGWLYFKLKKFDEAKVWVKRALDWWDWDPKAMSLMWQICGEQKDYLCVIKYRKQLGLPTHFNVEQYRDVQRAWQEQAIKNGVGLAAQQKASTSSPKPPAVTAVEIVPLAARVPPELTGMAEFLRREFPSLKISVAEREDLPAGAYSIERQQIMWERLIERLREQPGRIYVVEQDLAGYDEGFAFARYDLAKGRGVVSLSRMRSLVGDPTDASATYDDEIRKAVRHRLASELVRGVGKLIGMSFPCSEASCSMQERRSIADFVLHSPSFCPKHEAEMKEALVRAQPH